MNPTASLAYRKRQSLESAVMIKGLLESPDKFKDHIKRSSSSPVVIYPSADSLLVRYATSVVFAIAYGRRVRSLDDKIVTENNAVEVCKLLHLTVFENTLLMANLQR